MKTTLCIIRHGETDWNRRGIFQGRKDIELNTEGRNQAHNVSRYFINEKWDHIVSSPLIRAKETAEIIRTKTEILNIDLFEEIIERDFGEACGMEPELRKIRFPDGVFDGEEDWELFRGRIINGIEKIANTYIGKKIVVVSHGGVIDAVLATFLKDYKRLGMRLQNTCLNLIHYENGKWSVEFHNKTYNELMSM